MLTSHYFPAWFLGTYPEKRIILASYEAQFAASWGRKARDVLERQGVNFGVQVSGKSSAADWWETSEGGAMMTTGVGGPATGKGADVFLIDDPVKNAEEALSPTYRQRAEDWYQSVASTRLEPGGSICLIQTRWHDSDLAGRLLGRGGWTVFNLPALAGPNDILGRQPGQALWPARYDEAALARIRKEVGEHWFQSLYQQEPYPEGGALFKPDRASWYEDLGDGYRMQSGAVWPYGHCVRFAVVDPSVGRKTSADPVAMGVFSLTPDDTLLVLDMVSERMPIPELVPRLDGLCRKWGVEYAAVESNGFQIQVVREARSVMDTPIREVTPHGKSKLVRAYPAIIRMEAGQIALPRGNPDWKGPFISELSRWTGDEREVDDMVDVLGYSVRELMSGRLLLPSSGIDPAPREDAGKRDRPALEPSEASEERWQRRRLFGYGR